MKRRAFIGLGAVSISAGLLHSVGAFSSLSAGRGVVVSAASDPKGILGINDEVYPVEFTNNTDNLSMTVTLESTAISFDVDDDGEFEEPVTFNIDEIKKVGLQGDDGTVSISVNLFDNGSVVGSIDLDRIFEVPGVAAIRQVTGSVTGAFGNGRYEFSLTNESDDVVTLDGFGVDWTDNSNAAWVGRDRGNDAILKAGGTQRIAERFRTNGDVVDVSNNQEITLDGTGVDFEMGRFSNNSGNGVAVNDVDLIVRGSDNPDITVTVELRAD
ncbi:hypothetical protein [Natronorubrum sp. DTA28]|uniref:hypothetical protein n=1 Tax=Natronorubrum sp. DTA28 TaxID=3447019 RepID=UPI003F85BFEA